MKKILIVCIFLLHNSWLFSQYNWQLEVVVNENSPIKIPDPGFSYPDTISIKKQLRQFLNQLNNKGYISASVDSIFKNDNRWKAIVSLGEKYTWAIIHSGNIKPFFLARTSFSEKIFFKDPVQFSKVGTLQQQLFRLYENNGFPFASISLDSFILNNNHTIEASLHAEEGPFIVYDSITSTGTGKIANAYLYNYLGIKPKRPYNESIVKNLKIRLKELSFLQQGQDPEIQFSQKGVHILLDLKKRNANQFSGVVGVVPSNDQDGNVLITGDVRLKLVNMLRRGEMFDLQWQRLQTATQLLNVHVQYPFLFNTPIGIEGKFNFYRIDSSFYTIQMNAALMYLMKGNNQLRFFYQYQTSRKILDEYGQSAISGIADADFHLLGIGTTIEKLDYRINPSRGFAIRSDISLGYKTIFPSLNDTLNVLDSIQPTSLQLNGHLQAEVYQPIYKKLIFKVSGKAAWMWNNQLFRSELFRLGGLSSIRGFDDQSIFASAYGIGSIELRYLLDENSHVHIFGDAGWYQRTIRNETYSSYLVGFGAGITFQTKIGMLTVSYALGSQQNAPIDFRRSKIHIGYINYF